MSEKDSTCYIYIIAHKAKDGTIRGPVKVGITNSLDSRFATIQTGNPTPLALAFWLATPDKNIARSLEHAFHTVYAKKRLNGEWFDMPAYAALRGMCENMRAALQHFLGDDPELLAQAFEFSRLNEAFQLVANIDKLAEAKGLESVPQGETLN
jgi:hypothetical protein